MKRRNIADIPTSRKANTLLVESLFEPPALADALFDAPLVDEMPFVVPLLDSTLFDSSAALPFHNSPAAD